MPILSGYYSLKRGLTDQLVALRLDLNSELLLNKSMRYRPTIIVILLMLFGFQSTVAAVSVDIHTDEQGCLELSVEANSADCDSLESHDVASIESTEQHDHELTVCDHCGGCCNCHSNASVLINLQSFTRL